MSHNDMDDMAQFATENATMLKTYDRAQQAAPQPEAVQADSREYQHAMGDWLGAVSELIEAMGRPAFKADTPVHVIAEAIREAAKRLAAQQAAPQPETQAVLTPGKIYRVQDMGLCEYLRVDAYLGEHTFEFRSVTHGGQVFNVSPKHLAERLEQTP